MIDLKLLTRFLLRRWWIILIPVVIVSFVALPRLIQNEQAGAGGYQTSFSYSAAQSASNLPERDGDYQDVWLASEFLVNAFTDWIKSSTFRAELVNQLGSDTFLSGLGIATDNSRSIGIVYLSHPDASALEQVANAAIIVLSERNQAYFPHLGGIPAIVTLLDAPLITPSPPALPDRFAPLVQLAIAAAAGLLIAMAAEATDRTIRDEDEVFALGIRVLASVPDKR
jgi:capsular polysaccharide biosynthesis protein